MISYKSLVKLFLVSALIIFFAGCSGNASKQQGYQPGAVPYKVAPVYFGDATIEFDFPTTIQGEQNVEIRPKVDGFVQNIFVDEGDVVKKGQALFQLSNPQYEQAVRSSEAAVKIAEANVLSAKMEYEKVKPLVEKGIISKYEMQAKQYTLQSAEASLASANADLVNAKVNVGYTYLTSPSDGIIGNIPYKKGSLVNSLSGSALTTVYETKNVYAYFSLNEKELLNFSRHVAGSTIQDKLATMQDVTLVLADGTQYPQKGRITTATGLINIQTGSANFRATFPNTQGLIRSGSSGTIKIPVTIDNSIMVPQAATFDNQGKKFIYRYLGKDSINSVGIEVIESGIGNLYIVVKGLTKDDQIVIEGVESIRPGTKITPIHVNSDSIYRDATNRKRE
ncbi:MAG TPA: efflux RND transporter periplasmic adaptor subunit [Puia sp.]|nr:efflux RND transporter periplasmic adaptor subunit [Puia sp.]